MLLDDRQLQEGAARTEALLAEIEALPDDAARETAIAAIQALVRFYGEGLARIVAFAGRSDSDLLDAMIGDDLIAHLLILHDLHPRDPATRVAEALDEIRPYLRSHGGDVELLGIDDGLVYVRLQGSCQGCQVSTATLKQTIEDAIRKHAPDLDGIDARSDVVQPASQGNFVPLSSIHRPAASRHDARSAG